MSEMLKYLLCEVTWSVWMYALCVCLCVSLNKQHKKDNQINVQTLSLSSVLSSRYLSLSLSMSYRGYREGLNVTLMNVMMIMSLEY